MEVSGAAERIGLTLQRCRWLSVDVIMVLVGLICGITPPHPAALYVANKLGADIGSVIWHH
ncbi:hypothetical protein ACN61_05045 [Escherichia coli]|nr:hypothetical protein ACN61_05045 [Escherichia coli]